MRKPRQFSKTGYYHVLIRGVNKQNIFFEDSDRTYFISLLKKYSFKLGIEIHGFCLMENHVHLIIADKYQKLSLFMQSLASVYARKFNLKYDRTGHLFQERFKSEIIDTEEYFLTVFRYIHQNPQKALICKTSEYKWSSYKLYKNKFSFVKKHTILSYVGTIQNLYKLLNTSSSDECMEIDLRPSEKQTNYLNRIKQILQSNNPIIPPDLPIQIIVEKIRKIKEAGISIRNISRITGISSYIIQKA